MSVAIQLFMQEDEMSQLKAMLEEHGLENGIMDLVSLSEKVGEEFGLKVSATCDAKYLEVGISCKSDNVDTILDHLRMKESKQKIVLSGETSS